jgi:site-specific DNA recombinase
MVSCQKCGYAFSRTSTYTTARKIHYYKCIGSDSWRKLGGPVCDNGRFVRQDLLDQIVWTEVMRLLEDPSLIQQELDRRLAAARSSDPAKKREQSLQRELAHVGKGIERLLSAYQEALMSIEELRERMPALRQREQALRTELQAIADQANERAVFLRLAETLTAFLARLHGAADTLSIIERQRIVRLVVKDVLIGDDTITIRHSIPVSQGAPQGGCPPSSQARGPNYLLCKGRDHTALRGPTLSGIESPSAITSSLEHCLDQAQHPAIGYLLGYQRKKLVMVDRPEKVLQVPFHDPLRSALYLLPHFAHCVLCRSPSPISEVGFIEYRFENWLYPIEQCLLAYPVINRWDGQCKLHWFTVRIWDGRRSAIHFIRFEDSALKC